MDEKLNVLLHEENVAVSSVVSEGQSPESIEQEEVTQKSVDIDTDKMEATQDGVIFSKPLPEEENPLSGSVSIDNVIVLDDGPVVITLKIRHHFTRKIKYATIKLEDLTPSGLKDCVTKNGGMNSDWDALYKRLMKSIRACWRSNLIPIINGHTKLGWHKSANGLVFLHEQMISSDNQSSQYMGNIDIKPKGSLDNIVSMIKQWILSTPEWSPLQAVIAFSVAAVVLAFAKFEWGFILNNLVVHLAGTSTTGKSTALKVHAGFASNPFSEKNGFWLNHQSSLAALIRRIVGIQGLPVSIDELSSAPKRDYTDFVYTIGNGVEKDRLKAGGTALCRSGSFSTIVVSSGEHSMLNKCSANAGIRARGVEFRNVKWTDSKEQADAISDCLQANYGMIAPLVAEELLNNSDLWKARWDQIYNKIKNQMDEENIRLTIGSRISEFVVLFVLAAEIANKVLSINLDVDEIYKFCYFNIITINDAESNIRERAYDYLLHYAGEHKDDFPDLETGTMPGSYYSAHSIKGFFRQAKRYRMINGKEYRLQLVFLKEAYEKILNDAGFDHSVVSGELREANFLQVKDKKRYIYPLAVNDFKHDCYIIYTVTG